MWKYYQIPVFEGHENINIRMTTIIGEVDLYVSKCPYQSYECAGTHGIDNPVVSAGEHPSYLPNSTYFLATSSGLDYDYLSISRNDPSSCSYIIAVYSTNYYSEYQISFTMEDSILSLQPGVSISDHVEARASDYFSFSFTKNTPIVGGTDDMQINNNAMIQVTVTPIYGDPDIFISTSEHHPALGKNTTYWKSYKYGADTITIFPYDSDGGHELYLLYICVWLERECLYPYCNYNT